MKVSPGFAPTAIMTNDLRRRMRGWRWAGVTTLYVALLATVALAFLLHSYTPTSGQSVRTGIHFFQALSILQLFLIVFVTPASLAGAIAGERQHRTWDLLLASRVSMGGIVSGKLMSGIAFNLVLVGASLPLFGLVFLFGGMAPPDLIPAFVVFAVTILLLGAISVFVSTLTARLTVSYMISTLIALALVVGVSLLTLYLQSPGAIDVISLGSFPFQSGNQASPLTPLAQLDPLMALLSTLPSESGGSLLGGLGTVDRAFGLPLQLPLWGAYSIIMVACSTVLLLGASRFARSPVTLGLHLSRTSHQPARGKQ